MATDRGTERLTAALKDAAKAGERLAKALEQANQISIEKERIRQAERTPPAGEGT